MQKHEMTQAFLRDKQIMLEMFQTMIKEQGFELRKIDDPQE